MRVEEIKSYHDLQAYIQLELARQTIKRKTLELDLPEEWFFKLATFIRFVLNNDPKEKGVEKELSKDCKKYILKINKVFTIVTRK